MAKKTAKELLKEAIKADTAIPAKMPEYKQSSAEPKPALMPKPDLPKMNPNIVKTWTNFKPSPEMKKRRK